MIDYLPGSGESKLIRSPEATSAAVATAGLHDEKKPAEM